MSTKISVRNPLFSNPFNILSHFDSYFPMTDNLFDSEPRRQAYATTPRANITKKDRGYTIELAAPGFSREDFELNLENGMLSVAVGTSDTKEYTESLVQREWGYSSFRRSWSLPETANIEAVSARYDAGILYIEVPTEKNVETRRVINVE